MSATPVDLSPAESLRVLRDVLVPMVAQGAIVRRPRVTAWAERRQVDRTANATLSALRARHGGAPLVLRLGPRRLVLVVEPDDVARLLDGSPEPFTPATREKRGALAHFQPRGVLISPTERRRERRPFNEAALDMSEPVHADAAAFVGAVARETEELARTVRDRGTLDWDTFAATFWRIVRTVTFGPGARDDERLTEVLAALRSDGNWSSFRPQRRRLRRELEDRIAGHVERAVPGSLAARGRRAGGAGGVDVAGQIPHWLFAFDAAGIATFRALAVLAARPLARERVLGELAAAGSEPSVLPYARGTVLESVRLWPTTLVVLRDATEPTRWGERTLPAGTGFAIMSGFFHRDAERLDFAHAFAPEAWLDGRADADWALVPFSGGPVACPGRNLVLLVTSHVLARVAALDLDVARGEHLAADPLPATVDHAGLRLTLRERVPSDRGTVGVGGRRTVAEASQEGQS